MNPLCTSPPMQSQGGSTKPHGMALELVYRADNRYKSKGAGSRPGPYPSTPRAGSNPKPTISGPTHPQKPKNPLIASESPAGHTRKPKQNLSPFGRRAFRMGLCGSLQRSARRRPPYMRLSLVAVQPLKHDHFYFSVLLFGAGFLPKLHK